MRSFDCDWQDEIKKRLAVGSISNEGCHLKSRVTVLFDHLQLEQPRFRVSKV